MVNNWAMIQNSVVVNVCLWDGDTNTWQPPSEYLMKVIPEGSGAGIGWGWDGTNFVEPMASTSEPEPASNPALNQSGSPPNVIQ